MYNEEKRYIREKEDAGEILVIRPLEALNISPMEKKPSELDRVYKLGRREAEKLLLQKNWITD